MNDVSRPHDGGFGHGSFGIRNLVNLDILILSVYKRACINMEKPQNSSRSINKLNFNKQLLSYL